MKPTKFAFDVAAVRLGDGDYLKSCLTLKFKPWQLRDVLLKTADHAVRHTQEPLEFVFGGIIRQDEFVCPKCGSVDIIPVHYGLLEDDNIANESSKELNRLDDAGEICCLGCDASDGYNLTCKSCNHRWEEYIGYVDPKMERVRNEKGEVRYRQRKEK